MGKRRLANHAVDGVKSSEVYNCDVAHQKGPKIKINE
jgi:hypothetical protein